MPAFLLDTNVVSELVKVRPDPLVLQWTARHAPSDLYLAAITLAELVRGVARLPDGKRRSHLKDWVEQDLRGQFRGRILAFDEHAALVCGEIMGDCDRRGQPRSFADAQIAAIAIRAGLRIATRNVGDFRPMLVAVVNPWLDR
jgi:predicted nucleic acid-binding protein